MRVLLTIISVFFVLLSTLAQSPEEDEVNFQSAIDWLDSKLNYVYYDNVNEKWWKNTFYVNEDKVVTIKHISSNRPNTANIKEKDYTVRSFHIQDIDPNSLKVTDVEKATGRITKGKRLELRTFGFQDAIHKTINNRRGSSSSFLFLAFPEILNDSLSNYAEIVKEKFKAAIAASTRIYSAQNETDIETIFNVLTGSFKSDSTARWLGEMVQPNVLKVETNEYAIAYFGYDTALSSFYLLTISSEGIHTDYFDLSANQLLTLKSKEGKQIIQIESANTFQFGSNTYFRQ